MKEILKLNEISPLVKNVFQNNYSLVSEATDPVGIMVRSFAMHQYSPANSVLCVGRAGAGTNNIPVADYAAKGIVVFNTPGANANAVKELVISALLFSSRKICQGVNWANGLVDGDKTVAEQVEKGKKAFGGTEILGKTLGVYGLGAIGKKVVDAAFALGMNVVGFDPYLPKDAEKSLPNVKIVYSKEELFSLSDYITFHVPLTDETRGLVSKSTLSLMKDGVKIINCSRGEIVDNASIIEACENDKATYVTDFPNSQINNKKNIICIPHLGASTEEAEDNCAIMAAKQMVDYIENGNIVNSVNYPRLSIEKTGFRTVVLFKGDISEKIKNSVSCGNFNYAIKKEFGVAFIDTNSQLSTDIINSISKIEGVISVRTI